MDVVTRARRDARTGGMLAVLLTGQAMAVMDGNIVVVAAPAIRTDLGGGGTAVQLILSGYLLTSGVLLVTCARLGDILGHRRAFLIGLGWFTAASLLCGLAPDAAVLVVARMLQAAGAALVMPQVFSLIQLNWDGTARRRTIGLYSMILAGGVALGQIVGGLVVTADLAGLGWRPAFLINVPVGAVLLLVGPRLLARQYSPAGMAPADARPRLDLVGVALLSVAAAAIIGPLIFGPDLRWPVWLFLVLIAGLGLLAAFVRYERSVADRPLLDLAVLRVPGVRPGLLACCVVMGCYTAFLLALTLRLQSSLGFSPLAAGLAFVPYAVGFGTLSLTWTRLPPRTRDALPIAGPVAFAVGAGAVVALARTDWPGPITIPLLMLAGAGHAAGYSPLIARVSSLVGTRLASALSALNSTGPLLANVLAVAGLGSVYFAGTPAAGLDRVMIIIAGCLLLATACAAREARVTAGPVRQTGRKRPRVSTRPGCRN